MTHSSRIHATAWQSEIQALAQTGVFASAVQTVYGAPNDSAQFKAFIESVSRGELSKLPEVSALDAQTMQGHLGAYASATDTIYINAEILSSQAVLIEVLTHELGHFIADKFYSGIEQPTSALSFTRELLSKNHALLLTGSDSDATAHAATHATPNADHPSGQFVLPGAESATEVLWFATPLHIDWARLKLPMMTEAAFAIFKQSQNDTDAFDNILPIGSKWGLQTHSDSHFDNNNIRGGIETIRKRWDDGIEKLDSQAIASLENDYATDRSYVVRGFSGNDAGVSNLIYRYGQISHALQDFYSHSNWLNITIADNGQWLGTQSLLDGGLGMPAQLNPGDYIPNSSVMVAMNGLDYSQKFRTAGVGNYSGKSVTVNWWVDIDQANWGKTFAQPIHSADSQYKTIGLMSGAVAGAIYYDTDYSLPLRAINRTGFFEKEYFRGFSHGGAAGAKFGQWASPLAKDDESGAVVNNHYAKARILADLQLQNDWDRMGNLIFKKYGIEGLQKFAQFALVEESRDLYVSTYSVAGGRWDWNGVNASPEVSLVTSFANLADESEAVSDTDAHAIDTRFVEVFYAGDDASLTTSENRTYLTQIYLDGKWVDSEAGLVSIHHQHDESEESNLKQAAKEQHAERGGRAVWSELGSDSLHHLGTTYYVQQINTAARVFINQFDVGIDVLEIVDAAGQVIKSIDIDHGDFDQTREMLLQQYNIQLNARPETEAHTSAKVLIKANLGETVLLDASEFFADQDVVHGGAHNPGESLHTSLIFVGHDETLPWLSLRSDGLLEISNLSAIASGTYQTYVSASDGASLLEGVLITLSIDPVLTIGNQTYSPDTDLEVTFEQSLSSAVSLYSQIYDPAGNAVSGLEQLALRVGDSAGTPAGLETSVIDTKLANPADHGSMQFFAYFHDSKEMVMLSLENQDDERVTLSHEGQLFASVAIDEPGSDQTNAEPNINDFYIPAIQDSIVGLSLTPQSTHIESKEPGRAYKVLLDTSVFSETLHQGAFGLLLVDLKTGHVVNPTTGVQIEEAVLNVDSVGDYAIYNADTPRDGQNRVNTTLLLDAQLNLNNLAFLPYYVAELPEGQTLFFGMGTESNPSASQIVRAGKNIFAVEEVLEGDADFDDLMVRVDAMRVFHADEMVEASNEVVAFDTGVVESLFADITSFDFINGGQGFALSLGENRDLFVNVERVQFQDGAIFSEYDLRGSFATNIQFSALRDGVQTFASPVYFTGEPLLDLHYQLIDTTEGISITGSRLNDFIALQGGGSKSVSGGQGNDVMDGGRGVSLLSGGVGQDTFFLDGRVSDAATTIVTDFEADQDSVTIWGWQEGISRISAIELGDADSANEDLTLVFENLLSGQPDNQPSSITLRGYAMSDFGLTTVDALNAQISIGTNPFFMTGQTVDNFGTHGYLYLS